MNEIKTFTIRDYEGNARHISVDMSLVRAIYYRESFGDEILKIEYKNGVIEIEDSSDCRTKEEGHWRLIYDSTFARLTV